MNHSIFIVSGEEEKEHDKRQREKECKYKNK